MDALTQISARPQVFGMCYVAAFALAWVMLLYEGRRRGWPLSRWLLLIAWTLLCSVIGSKLVMLTPGVWRAALGHGLIPATGMKSFLGMVIGGVAGAIVGRRMLGMPRSIADAFALAMPAGLAVTRIGCLLGGCCFGTPTALPWAIRYSNGALAQAVHTARGLVPHGAAESLPVHPVQVYEIVLLAVVLGILLWARPRLKRSLSLFLLCLVLQSLTRFGVEFLREGPPVPRLLGVSLLQAALVAVALGCGVLLWLRVRRRAHDASGVLVRGPLALVGLTATTGLGLLLLGGWFTPLERAVLIVLCTPAVFIAALAATREAGPALRWSATAVLAGTMLLPPESTESNGLAGHTVYYNVTAGGALADYQVESCSSTDYYSYREAAFSMSLTDDYGDRGRLELGLGLAVDEMTENHTRYTSRTYRPLLSYDHRWAGISLGAIGGKFEREDSVWFDWFWAPSGGLRLGPEDIAYVELSVLDEPTGNQQSFRLGLGFGSIERNDYSLRLGLCGIGNRGIAPAFYLSPSFVMANQLAVCPMAAWDLGESYHLGLSLSYSYGGLGRR